MSWPRGQLVKRTELRHPKLVLRPIRCDHHHHQFLSSLESRFMEISTVFKVTRITFPIAMRKFIPNKHSPFLSPYLLIPTYPHLPNLFALTNRLPLFIVEEKKEGSINHIWRENEAKVKNCMWAWWVAGLGRLASLHKVTTGRRGFRRQNKKLKG